MGGQQPQQPIYTDEVVVWPEQLVVQKISASLSIIGSYIIAREVLAEEFSSTFRTTTTTASRRRSSAISQRDSGAAAAGGGATIPANENKSNGSSAGNSLTTTTSSTRRSLRRNSSSIIISTRNNNLKNLKTKAISRILLSLSIGDICISLGYLIGNVVSTDDINQSTTSKVWHIEHMYVTRSYISIGFIIHWYV